MPHITIAVSPRLADAVDWSIAITSMHREIASRELAALADLKTRVQRCDYAVVGDDAASEQVIATLVMTNPRTDADQKAMADIVIDHLGRAARRVATSGPTQCCVFFHYVPKTNYLRRDL